MGTVMHKVAAAVISVVGWAAAFAADAQDKATITLDPLSPASCETAAGQVVVQREFMVQWDKATMAGRIDPARAKQIAAWLLNEMAATTKTDNVKGLCLAQVAKRREQGF